MANPSTLTLNPGNIDMGQTMGITINRESAGYTHTVTYEFKGASGTIATKTSSTSLSLAVPLAWASYIPNAAMGVGSIHVETYDGSTLIGSRNHTFNAYVPESVVPTISSLNFTRIDGDVPAGWGIYVKSKSKATAQISGASGVYGSTIKAYTIRGDKYAAGAGSLTTGFLKLSGNVVFTAGVMDSRDRTGWITNSIDVADWGPPVVDSLLVQRCTASGDYDNDGEYFKVNCAYSFSSVSGKNSASAKMKYGVKGSGTPIQENLPISNGTDAIFGPVDTDITHEVTVEISDTFETTVVKRDVPTAVVALDFKSNGRGIGIGKIAEIDDTLDIAWDTKIRKNLDVTENLTVAGNVTWPNMPGGVYCKLRQTTDLPDLSSGVDVAMPFDSVQMRSHESMWSSSEPQRIYAPVSGLYLVSAIVSFSTNSTGIRFIRIVKNGATYSIDRRAAATGQETVVSVTDLLALNADDYVVISLYQNSGSALTVKVFGYTPQFFVIKIG